MKKIISILAGALLITASTFAMDLSVMAWYNHEIGKFVVHRWLTSVYQPMTDTSMTDISVPLFLFYIDGYLCVCYILIYRCLSM